MVKPWLAIPHSNHGNNGAPKSHLTMMSRFCLLLIWYVCAPARVSRTHVFVSWGVEVGSRVAIMRIMPLGYPGFGFDKYLRVLQHHGPWPITGPWSTMVRGPPIQNPDTQKYSNCFACFFVCFPKPGHPVFSQLLRLKTAMSYCLTPASYKQRRKMLLVLRANNNSRLHPAGYGAYGLMAAYLSPTMAAMEHSIPQQQ